MSMDAKPVTSSSTPASPGLHREKGIRIFMWPKVIFLYPTAIVALICAVGMSIIHDRTHDPTRPITESVSAKHLPPGYATSNDLPPPPLTKVDRFLTPQNLLAM